MGGGGVEASSLKKKFFLAFRASILILTLTLKIRGETPPGPSSGSATAIELRTESAIVMSKVTIKVVTSSFEGTRHGSD